MRRQKIICGEHRTFSSAELSLATCPCASSYRRDQSAYTSGGIVRVPMTSVRSPFVAKKCKLSLTRDRRSGLVLGLIRFNIIESAPARVLGMQSHHNTTLIYDCRNAGKQDLVRYTSQHTLEYVRGAIKLTRPEGLRAETRTRTRAEVFNKTTRPVQEPTRCSSVDHQLQMCLLSANRSVEYLCSKS
jgi:hypothetical protein